MERLALVTSQPCTRTMVNTPDSVTPKSAILTVLNIVYKNNNNKKANSLLKDIIETRVIIVAFNL